LESSSRSAQPAYFCVAAFCRPNPRDIRTCPSSDTFKGDAVTSFLCDLRHALRFLRLSPGFTIVAVLTRSLGVGANTAIFQLIDPVRLRTIPVKNPQELGTIRIADRGWGSGQFSSQYSQLTFAMWEQIRKRQEGFSKIAVWSDQQFNLATGGE